MKQKPFRELNSFEKFLMYIVLFIFITNQVHYFMAFVLDSFKDVLISILSKFAN